MDGIITGIGDRKKKINLISPQLDAEVYKSIINRNGIITGLEIIGNTLTRGICIAEGYRGELRKNADGVTQGTSTSVSNRYSVTVGTTPSYQDETGVDHYTGSTTATFDEGVNIVSAEARNTAMTATFSKNVLTIYGDSVIAGSSVSGIVDIIYMKGGSYIYGKFVVNHDFNTPDHFSVLILDAPLAYENDDILHEPGTYYLPLYEAGFKAVDEKNYPKYCAHADYAKVIRENGTLGAGTVAVTQPVDDNSDKVATTEYVANQIKKDIDFKEETVQAYDISDNKSLPVYLKFRRKAKMVVVNVYQTRDLEIGEVDSHGGKICFSIPSGFEPKNDIYFMVAARTANGVILTNFEKISAGANIATPLTIPSLPSETSYPAPNENMCNFGYEIN